MEKKDNFTEDICKCIKIDGYLEDVNWIMSPRLYKPSPGYLAISDWNEKPYIWLHYVESSDGIVTNDDVLMTTNSRFWDIHDVQRYFMGNEHCDQVLFTYQYPNLRLPSAFGNHFWRANLAMKAPSNIYQKELYKDLEITLKKMEANEDQVDRMIIPDELVHLDRLDYFRRKSFLNSLLNVLSLQDDLQLVSFENMRCKRLEGVRLVQQLACFNAHSLKYLFLWQFVLLNENPLLINYSYITGTGQYIPRPSTRQCFTRSLGSMQNLRLLALEYSYLADGTGGALLSLLPVMKRPHFRLHLICRESFIPGRTDTALGAGGYGIPDTAWKRVTSACPDLYLFVVFFRFLNYDNVTRFLTPSMGLREVHWQRGIDLTHQRHDSDLSCYARQLSHRYADTLITVGLYHWRCAIFTPRYVLEMIPLLVRLYFTGSFDDEVELRRTLNLLASGVFVRLKQIRIIIQDFTHNRVYWKNVVDVMNKEYREAMALNDITLCLDIYQM